MIYSLLAIAGIFQARDEIPACNGPVVEYNVTYEGGRLFHVEAHFAIAPGALDLYFFPTPDHPEGQAEFIRDLVAYNEAGDAVPITYTEYGTWEVTPGTRSVEYRVSATHDDTEWGPGKDEVGTVFDDTFFFVGNTFLLADYSWPDCPGRIEFNLPEGWRVTSPWGREGKGFVGETWERVTHNGFALGQDPAESSLIGDISIQWVVADALEPIKPRINDIITRLLPVYIDYFGGASVSNYATFFFTDKMSDGGAFRDSFAMRIATPLTSTEEITWSHTLGHELLHTWIGSNGITSSSLEDFDHTYWFLEGFTDYLTVKLMVQAGLISHAQYERRLAGMIERYRVGQQISPGLTLKVAGEDKGANWELIYGGGAVMAWLLDAEMARENPEGMRPMMRTLFKQSDRPYNFERLIGIMDQETQGVAREVYNWVNEVQSVTDLRRRFADLGFEVSVFRFDEAYVRAPLLVPEN